MKLEKLLPEITPLPWPDDGFEMTPQYGSTHAELSRNDWVFARHAANILPDLIAELKWLLDCVNPDDVAQIEALLERAENVKEL